MDVFQILYGRFLAIEWRELFSSIRDFVTFLDAVLLAFFIYLFVRAWKLRPRFVSPFFKPAQRVVELKDPALVAKWEEIKRKAGSAPPQSLVVAIMDADKFTDVVLKRLGFKGKHMADRLEQLASSDMKSIDRLWRAHRARNDLAHTPDYRISPVDAHEILGIYEEFLKELGAL